MKTLLITRSGILAVVAMLLVGLLSACNTSNKNELPYADSFLVDVRTPQEFNEGSVKGAVNIPLSEIESRIDEFKGKKQIVVFCRSGSRSTEAKRILEANGVTGVVNGGPWQNVAAELEKQAKK
ncbi:MAG: rhodanese-like domain-containing protein [Chitinophagales bacterium]|nr:rhodanese-like domain-containing protein [Chitinophagales bacterium]